MSRKFWTFNPKVVTTIIIPFLQAYNQQIWKFYTKITKKFVCNKLQIDSKIVCIIIVTKNSKFTVSVCWNNVMLAHGKKTSSFWGFGTCSNFKLTVTNGITIVDTIIGLFCENTGASITEINITEYLIIIKKIGHNLYLSIQILN